MIPLGDYPIPAISMRHRAAVGGVKQRESENEKTPRSFLGEALTCIDISHFLPNFGKCQQIFANYLKLSQIISFDFIATDPVSPKEVIKRIQPLRFEL